MSYLILPGDVLARIYDQPIALNFAHAGLTRLVAAWYARDGDRPFDMVRGLTGGKSGSFPMTRSTTHEMGYGHRTPFGGVETTDLPEWARSNNPAYSLLAISLNTGSTASSQVAITQQGAGWAGAQIYEGNGSSSVIRGGTTRDTTSAGSTGIAVPIGRRYCAVVVDQSTTIQCAVNGQLDTAGSPAGSYNATQSRLASGDTARPVYLMLCWRRALSRGEQIEYSARPDQLFKREPEVSYFLFQAAGGGGYDISGEVTATLAAATLSATGALAITGTASPTLAAATLSATGAVAITGSTSATLAAATLSATGALAIVGTLSKTLDDATLAAEGALVSGGTGTLSQTLADATLSATGTVAIAGTTSATLADATLSAAGALAIVGTLSQTLENATLNAYSASPNSGTLSVTLADATLVATGSSAGDVRGRLVRRRRRLLVDRRVYDDLSPADARAAAQAAGIAPEQIREVTYEPVSKAGLAPTREDALGLPYWTMQEFWGPQALQRFLALSAPIDPSFFAVAADSGPLAAPFLRQRAEQEALLLLLTA